MKLHRLLSVIGAASAALLCSAEVTVAKPNVRQRVSDYIPIDNTKHYELTVSAKGGDGKINVWLEQFDVRKRPIGAYNVNAVMASVTETVSPIVRGQKSFTVKNGAQWTDPKRGAYIFCYNVKADGSDMPNFNYDYQIRSITKQPDGNWKIELSNPLRVSCPAGTLVRQQWDGDNLGGAAQWGTTLPRPKPYSIIVKPVAGPGAQPSGWWLGAKYARVVVSASEAPVSVSCTLTEVTDMAKLIKIKPYGERKIVKEEADCWEFDNAFHFWSGISASGVKIPAAQAAQLECDFKSPTPGFLQLRFTQNINGQERSLETPVQSVIPDNSYRRFRFRFADAQGWDKEAPVTGWNVCFRHYNEMDRIIGFRRPKVLNQENLAVGADAWQPGKALELPDLRPLGKYRLTWENGSCPGAEVRFYDHRLQQLPGTAKLAPGAKETTFTMPELAVRATVIPAEKGNGFPRVITVDYRRRYTPELFWKGQWIWTQLALGPFFEYVVFCKEFDLDDEPEFAAISVMADDISETRINGQYAGTTWRHSQPDRFFVTKSLKKGRNKIEVRVFNGTLNAGLCVDFYARSTSGKEFYLATDKTWKFRKMGKSKEFPTSYNGQAAELGAPATTPPWANNVRFTYAGPRGRFTLLNSKNGKFTAKLEKPVINVVRSMNFERRGASGKREQFLLPVDFVRNADGTVTVTYPALRPTEEDCEVNLNDDFFEVADGRPLDIIAGTKPVSRGLQQAELVNAGRHVMIRLNGNLYDPAFLQTNEYERIMPAVRQGFRNFVVTANFDSFWKGENQYDFTQIDHAIEHLLTVCPDGVFMLDIRFWMPEWWLKAHPDDTTRYFNPAQPRDTYLDMQALGSKNWLKCTDAPLAALIDHVSKSFYADRIWGANIGESRNGEWFWNNRDNTGKFAIPGNSPSELRAFREGLKHRYKTNEALAKAWRKPGLTFDTVQFPDPELRKKGTLGGLHDPRYEAPIMDWYRFRSDALTEAVLYFGASIKKLTNRKWLTGAYYGYWMELTHDTYRATQISGHNGAVAMAKSADIDFCRAPSDYNYRKVGMPNSVMQPFSTFTLRHKLVLIEHDERCAYGPREGTDMDMYAGRNSTGPEAVGCVDREFGMPAAIGAAGYWLDHPRGSLYEPALLAAIGDQLRYNAGRHDVQELAVPEMAVVGDEESTYYNQATDLSPFGFGIYDTMKQMNKIAAPFRNFMTGDMLDGDLVPAHKFYVMLPTLVLTQEQRKALMARFEKEHATVLWFYSAGSSYPDKGLDAAYCGDFFGLKCTADAKKRAETLKLPQGIFTSRYNGTPHFYAQSGYDKVIAVNASGRPVVVQKKVGNATHIFSTLVALPVELLRRFAEEAGVYCYAPCTGDQWWIGNDVLFCHAVKGGKKQVTLPKGFRMKAVIGPLRGEIDDNSWEAVPGMTYGFQLERE